MDHIIITIGDHLAEIRYVLLGFTFFFALMALWASIDANTERALKDSELNSDIERLENKNKQNDGKIKSLDSERASLSARVELDENRVRLLGLEEDWKRISFIGGKFENPPIDVKALYNTVSKREGGKKRVSASQIREVCSLLLDELHMHPIECVIGLINNRRDPKSHGKK